MPGLIGVRRRLALRRGGAVWARLTRMTRYLDRALEWVGISVISLVPVVVIAGFETHRAMMENLAFLSFLDNALGRGDVLLIATTLSLLGAIELLLSGHRSWMQEASQRALLDFEIAEHDDGVARFRVRSA
jgi:hypothetical protein